MSRVEGSGSRAETLVSPAASRAGRPAGTGGGAGLLDGRVVLVSGGTQGVGAAVAREAAREGAVVAVTGRRREPGAALVEELRAAGSPALFVPCDVADVAACRAAVEAVVAEFGRVDALVNAAGLTARGTLTDTTPELFDAHIAINLRGPFFLMQAVVADLLTRGAPGGVVNIISSSELGGQPYLAPYVAAKAGLAGLTRNAAHAHRWDRIRINGLDIGWTDTEGEDATQREFHAADDGWRERAGKGLPMGRLGRAEDVAAAVVFLLSDRSGVVTGSVLDWDQNVFGGLD
jgi:NAD(P)-dependent dehydrogenase (short-subunit alcohol dehydrogenase family)